jgi:hypothetical protein
MSWRDEYDQRLRRVVGITDDSLPVIEDSETRWSGGCETCNFSYEVVVVQVFSDWKRGTVMAEKEFYDMGTLLAAMDKVTL